jgi:DNA mismatch repair ATPase MutS
VLQEIRDKIGGITGFCCYDWHKWASLGNMLETYYLIYVSMDYEESLRYSVGFEGYMNILSGISRNYLAGSLGKCTFVETGVNIDIDEEDEEDEEKTETRVDTSFTNQRHPAHPKGVRNTCNLNNNILITGVNASGKTTLLKTTAINIIVSQQFGFGFYESANIVPYNHVHSYINIPDTSGRDSLFQAESRRCKEILDKIRDTKTERHFCIFDELYSGTNPKEAAKSAYSLLRYLSKIEGVRFMLTTHYVSVCKRFEKDMLGEVSAGKETSPESSNVVNYHMESTVDDSGTFHYTYRFLPGISMLEGGLEILKTMDYPEEILMEIRNTDSL